MKTKDKIIACYGHLTATSVGKMFGKSNEQVHNTWNRLGLFQERINQHRSRKGTLDNY